MNDVYGSCSTWFKQRIDYDKAQRIKSPRHFRSWAEWNLQVQSDHWNNLAKGINKQTYPDHFLLFPIEKKTDCEVDWGPTTVNLVLEFVPKVFLPYILERNGLEEGEARVFFMQLPQEEHNSQRHQGLEHTARWPTERKADRFWAQQLSGRRETSCDILWYSSLCCTWNGSNLPFYYSRILAAWPEVQWSRVWHLVILCISWLLPHFHLQMWLLLSKGIFSTQRKWVQVMEKLFVILLTCIQNVMILFRICFSTRLQQGWRKVTAPINHRMRWS